MNLITTILIKLGILKKDLDYHFVRASMVIIHFFSAIRSGFSMRLRG